MIRAAVIGLGVIGKLHAELTLLNGNLVAVCDVDESCLNLYPSVKQYKDYVRMLDEVKPDVVHICTPHYLHAEMVLASLKRNVNVLCEKPLALTREDMVAIAKASQVSTGKFMVGQICRFTPAFEKAKGQYGRVADAAKLIDPRHK